MPPLVAHVPREIKNLHSARTSLIRSASCGGGDRAFNDANVIRTGFHGPGGFQEVGNIHGSSQIQQFVFQISSDNWQPSQEENL